MNFKAPLRSTGQDANNFLLNPLSAALLDSYFVEHDIDYSLPHWLMPYHHPDHSYFFPTIVWTHVLFPLPVWVSGGVNLFVQSQYLKPLISKHRLHHDAP